MYHCGNCGQPGHRIDKCPNWEISDDSPVDDLVVAEVLSSDSEVEENPTIISAIQVEALAREYKTQNITS